MWSAAFRYLYVSTQRVQYPQPSTPLHGGWGGVAVGQCADLTDRPKPMETQRRPPHPKIALALFRPAVRYKKEGGRAERESST